MQNMRHASGRCLIFSAVKNQHQHFFVVGATPMTPEALRTWQAQMGYTYETAAPPWLVHPSSPDLSPTANFGDLTGRRREVR